MQVRGTFTDIMGKKHSGVATVACNGAFVAAWSGAAQCVTHSIGPIGNCPNGAAATAFCARTSDGSLRSKLEQKQCMAQAPWADEEDDDENDEDYTSPFRRRLLGHRRRRLLRSEVALGKKKKKEKKYVEFPCGGFSASSGGDSASATEAPKYHKCPPCVTGQHNKKCEVHSKCEYA